MFESASLERQFFGGGRESDYQNHESLKKECSKVHLKNNNNCIQYKLWEFCKRNRKYVCFWLMPE